MENSMDIPAAEPMAPTIPPLEPVVYPDRSTGLTVFGIILILVGLFSAFLVPLSLLGVFLARKTGGVMPAGSYVMNISIYALSAVALVTLGVGSIRARRWGRNLALIASWLWLVYGAVSLVMITAILPASFLAGFKTAAARNPQAPPLPTGVMAVILTFLIAIMAVFFVVLPIVLVVFYRRKDVEETCKRRDPLPSWTERAPLRVLAASILCAVGALYYFQVSFTIPIFPFFGKYLTGWPASIVCLALAALDGFLAFSLFKRQILGWWVTITALGVRIVALAITIRRGNLLEAYARMGWSPRQLQLMQTTGLYHSGGVLWFGLVFLLLFLGYLIWIKRYFVATTQESSSLSPPDEASTAS